MVAETQTEATLWIGTWSSKCGACRGGADPREPAHITRLGYGDHEPNGCGATFIAVGSEYSGDAEAVVQAMRPDLPYVGLGGW